MANITLRDAAQWCGGMVEEKYADRVFDGAGNDTRSLQKGQLFQVRFCCKLSLLQGQLRK